MTDFLRSDWSLWPLYLWWAFFFPYQLIDSVRSGRDWKVFWASIQELPGKEGADVRVVLDRSHAILEEQRPRTEARRRRQKQILRVSIVAVAWAVLRLPFALGWV